MSYFDLNDILAEEEETTVTLKTKIRDMGHLDRSGIAHSDLEPGTKMSLPLWLSSVLYQEDFAKLETPKLYGKNFCSKVSADPKVVNLGSHPFW